MLTRELILYKVLEGTLRPTFINPEDPKLLSDAESLIDSYRAGIGLTRSALDDEVTPLIAAHRRSRLMKGLNKLLLDRCQFEKLACDDISDRRLTLFRTAAKMLRDQSPTPTLAEHRSRVLDHLSEGDRDWAQSCFSDLPDCEPLLAWKAIGPRALLHRYNCALAQTLLLYARHVELTFTEARREICRQVFAYLKFFRLIADINQTDTASFRVKIDGPLSLFSQTQKYGFQLAAFFPAIPLLQKWTLSARIHVPKRRSALLTLDDTMDLRSHYEQFATHIPPELTLFKQRLSEKNPQWRALDELTLVPIGPQDLCIPDITLEGPGGDRLFIELFHRWHHHTLTRRLRLLKKYPGLPLLIGVDRAIETKTKLKKPLEDSDHFKKKGFYFSGFPTAERVLKTIATVTAPNYTRRLKKSQSS